MSTLKISKHSDVPAALDLVKEEVDKEAERIHKAGGAALTAGQVKPAKEAIAYSDKLREFVKKLQKLGDEWTKLEARIDAAAPEVKEIVRLPKSQVNHKTGYSRKVTGLAPRSNFTVRFPDGTTIGDKEARGVLAKAIEKMGPSNVSALGVMIGGEPLVTKDRALFKKIPGGSPGDQGWLVRKDAFRNEGQDELRDESRQGARRQGDGHGGLTRSTSGRRMRKAFVESRGKPME